MNSKDIIQSELISWLNKQAECDKFHRIEITLGKLIEGKEQLAIYIYYSFLILNETNINEWPTIKQIIYLDKLLIDNKSTLTLLNIEWKSENSWNIIDLLTKNSIGHEISKQKYGGKDGS